MQRQTMPGRQEANVGTQSVKRAGGELGRPGAVRIILHYYSKKN